jgi:hypothetical protein
MPFVEKWIELEIMMLREISQSHKDKYHVFSLVCGISGWKKDVKVIGGL